MEVDVEPGDPHNDQLVAQAREELAQLVDSMRGLLEEAGGDRATAIVVAAVTLRDTAEERMSRARLAALLAAAVERLTPDPPAPPTSAHHLNTLDADAVRRFEETT